MISDPKYPDPLSRISFSCLSISTGKRGRNMKIPVSAGSEAPTATVP